MPDPLQEELLKRSWANPANRPPRDPVQWKNRDEPGYRPEDAPARQTLSVEDAVGITQPPWNLDENGGLLRNPDGSLNVVTDPQTAMYSPEYETQQKVLRYVLANQEKFPNGQPDVQDVLDAIDESDPRDLRDNADQDPEEIIQRVRAADAIARQNRER